MKLGAPENFKDDRQVRLSSIDRAIAQYQFSSGELKKGFADKLDEHTKLFLKGFGNEINLLAALRDLFFNSRELLDMLLVGMNKRFTHTPRDFLGFTKKMMHGDFDAYDGKIITFLKNNITFIFHIRKVRNEIKNKPSNIEFRFNTNHFETSFRVPINKDEIELIDYLDIQNKAEALRNMSYQCVYNLDALFPEMALFLKTAFSIYDGDVTS
jgi:hypothetical protein